MSTPVSQELFAPVAPGVQLCYQTFGSPEGEPLVLVMGLGGPLNWWDPELCTMLVEAGFHVVRFDNRDTSSPPGSRGSRVSRRHLIKSAVGRGGRPPYTLSDMAADVFGLMDHLGWESAHVVGVSMGGMIVQTMAIDQPARVRSLTSIMSTLGKRSVGGSDAVPAADDDRQAHAGSRGLRRDLGEDVGDDRVAGLSQGRGEGPDPRRGDLRPGRVGERGDAPDARHPCDQPNRSRDLAALRVPAAIVHGSADKMVHVSGGRATARAIPGAELLVIDGMGHDIPRELYSTLTDIIRRTADRAGHASKSDQTA